MTATYHVLTVPEALEAENVDQQRGLSGAEADARRQKFGPNRFAEAKREPWWRSFARQYADPMQLVLLFAGLGSLYPLKQWGTGVLLLALTLLNAALGLHQEGKAAAAIDALQKMMIVKARVRRDGTLIEVPAEDLVPGDVVQLEAGDVVPADGRLLRAATLEIDESALTGESLPVAKNVEPLAEADVALGDRSDMAYMNTNVTRGAGELLVTATGMGTEVGRISKMLATDKGADTPLTRQLAKLTNQILIISGIALLASVLINLARGNEFTVVFTAAVAFAVSAIPTGLPAVVTTILSQGTQLLAKANAIVKRLRSTETLGSTSAINSDKTGTLTLNQMTAIEMVIPGRRYVVSGSGYSTQGSIKRVAGEPDTPLEEFLLPMILASDAVVTDGSMIGDPTEGALVVLAEKGGLDAQATRERYPRIAELPFDAAYKLMATFHEMSGKIRCYVKGAPDQLLARSNVTPDQRERYTAENDRLARQGLRVMATAYRDFDRLGDDLLESLQDLTPLALVGIVDPPRPQARDAIEQAHAAGIEVRMITGDHAVTAAAIAGRLGIRGRAITGAEFAAMSDEEADREIGGIGVIARVTPEHKVRLVEVLRRRGHIVAMTGDGVNDAPALKKADIGIAMGITGTEVSKEAAAMILTDDDFATIVKAVALGRALYANLKKYIFFQMGTLVGMIITFLVASIGNIAAGVPFVPLQTLWLNFTTQIFQSVGLGYGKAEADIMSHPPRRSDEPLLSRAALGWLGILGLIMGAVTLVVIGWADHGHDVDYARTMGLTAFSIANLAFSLTVRSDIRSVFSLETFGDKRFVVTTGLSAAAIVLATEFGLFQKILHTSSLGVRHWLICLLAGVVVVIPTEIRKAVLRRRNGSA
ncbi:cation transport ATPase [Actinoplanes sp. SE50]|uniref:cation-translocating P-type ATPase n=1 Tax=unclassified Actinoplanes TaxID=2626549 RepID=UPI00023ECEA1|nr:MULTISPECIES: HAD-IC family P-type ATPase [unclassified Actinoplanes]AEV84865.1 Cation transport ATPase [Actinoplanes sp. SE50/110]ATO83256.1 cation transport ATPase [Actinoplanes sp. SE50]SLM00663.1 cation transport ATPase [Actinoplanes sp. SE50/110]